MQNKYPRYHPKLKKVARMLRKNSTVAEIMLWNELKGKQLLGFDFHRQKPISRYVLDFFCPRLVLAIEIDGSSHDDREKRDELRQTELEKKGITFLRFQDEEVKQNLDGVVDEIQDWILNHSRKRTHP